MGARRYTTGKLRQELIPDEFLEALSQVYTMGAEKYTIVDDNGNIIEDGSNNWRDGLSWKQTLGAIYRHLRKFSKGEDYDYDFPPEILKRYGPTLHLANAAWGLATLINYYKTHPELDDRHHSYLSPKRIGLDIDEVICNFTKGWHERWGEDPNPEMWNYDSEMGKRFKAMSENGELENFYLGLEPRINPSDIPFEPVCYVTSRPISTKITEAWLKKYKFPQVKVLTVPINSSKVDAIKQMNVDIFVDDKYDNFVELNNAGICTYLFDAAHNQRYEVGYRRIKNLKELL